MVSEANTLDKTVLVQLLNKKGKEGAEMTSKGSDNCYPRVLGCGALANKFSSAVLLSTARHQS